MLSFNDDRVLANAASKGDLSKVAELLNKGVNPSARVFVDSTPLLHTAKEGHE